MEGLQRGRVVGHGGVTEGQSSGTWRGLQRGRVVGHGWGYRGVE